MNPIGKNSLAVVGGIVIGGIVNMMLVQLGPHVVPLPEGADVSTMEGLEKSMPLFTPMNFLFPFLGHALGTLVGAFLAARFSASHHIKCALGIGAFYQLGGIMVANMIGGPIWFQATDLVLAYLPMGFLGAVAAGRMPSQSGTPSGNVSPKTT